MNNQNKIERAQTAFYRGSMMVLCGMTLSIAWSLWWMLLTAAGLGLCAWALWREEH